MAVFIAALGNDPAPVMQGFLEAKARFSINSSIQVILVAEAAETDSARNRRPNFEKWLRKNGANPIENSSPSTKIDTFKAVQIAFDLAKDTDVIVDATGGTKLLSIALWQSGVTKNAQVFTQNIHGDAKILNLRPQILSQPLQVSLPLRDFLDVYCPDNVQQTLVTPAEALLLQSLGLALVQVVVHEKDTDTHRYAVWLEKTQLHILYLSELKNGGSREAYVPIRDFAVRLGGGAVKTWVWTSVKNAAVFSDWKKQARSRNVVFFQNQQPSQPALILEPKQIKHPTSGTMLIAIASGQTIPVAQSYSRHEFQNAVVLRTPEMVAQAGRLHRFFKSKGLNSVIVDTISTDNPNSVTEAIGTILKNHHGQLVVNINGGTAALAIRLFDAIKLDNVIFEYIDGSDTYTITKNHELNLFESVPPRYSIVEHLRLNGISFEEQSYYDSETLRELAYNALENNSQHDLKAFAAKFNQHHKSQINGHDDGKAREYIVIMEITDALPKTEFQVFPGGNITDLRWQGNSTHGQDRFDLSVSGNSLNNEIDGIICHNGRMFLIEIKANLETAFHKQHIEQLHMPQIAGRTGGRFARGLIIADYVLKPNSKRIEVVRKQIQEAVELNGTRNWLSLWSCNVGEEWQETVKHFPDDLESYLRSVHH